MWLLMSWRIKSIRETQNEKERIRKKMIEMEQASLSAQMNPHFIFNCLNSIQQYVFEKDIFVVNKYITGFAKLIRTTLQNSTSTFISLAEETEYLLTYLELEKLRFKDKMDYSIEIDQGLKKEMLIPAMILQPYIENSIRHGIRHKLEGKGYVKIGMISSPENKLVCIIEDNGVGREKAKEYKTKEHIEYQSKGMSLTADRIKLINSIYGNQIKVEIIDLENEFHEPEGTRVIVEFPLYEYSSKEKML